MAEYIEKQWREITSRNPVSGEQFPQGLKDFKFSVGQGYGLIPAQSYFKVTLKVTVEGSLPGNAGNERVTFADGVCGNLFNNIYFNMGGQTISSITSGLPQCDILKNRLTKSSTYNKTIGETQGFQAHFNTRLLNMAYDVGSPEIENNDTRGRNQKSFIWQPAIGIFDVSQPLGAGEYDIQLNPSQDYKKASIDSYNFPGLPDGRDIGTGSTEVDLDVIDIRFYACLVRVNLPSSGVETLHLMEMAVNTANVDTSGGEINEEVSVPSSTRAITLFVQDQQAGKTTNIPPSKYHIAGTDGNKNANKIQSYQVEYAGMTKPTVRYTSSYDSNVLTLQQRYINSALESGQYFNPSGFETLNEYLERGPFFHESFIKSADNLATRAHIVAQYESPFNRAARLFVVAHHSKTIQITRQNGMVVNVVSLNV